MDGNVKKQRKPRSQESRAKQALIATAQWAKRKALKEAAAVDRDAANCTSQLSPATVEELTQSGAPALTPTNALEQPTDSPNNPGQTESSVAATPADGLEGPAVSVSRPEPMLQSKEPKLELGPEPPPPIEGSGTPSGPIDSPVGSAPILPDTTAPDLKMDQPEVTPTLTEAEAAQFLDANQPSESGGEPFSATSFNLNYLIATGQVERVELYRYMTAEQAAALKDQYVDGSLIHQNITRSTAGYVNSELVFLWLAPELAKFPEADINRAERALERMRWNKTENSNRSALKASGGRELNFGWRHAFGKIVQFVPTIGQKSNYMEIWPLVDRLDGLFARALPQIWTGQLLDQRSTGFTKTATEVSSFSGITLLGNAPSSAHLDAKNSGFVAMTTAGKFTGGEFLLIEFGLSIPVVRGSVLICSTQKHWHANFNNVRGTRYSILGFFTAALKGKTDGNGNTPVLPVTTGEGRVNKNEGDRPIGECGICHLMKPIHTHRNGIAICQACNMRQRRAAAAKESRGKLLRQAGTAIAALEQLAKLVGDPDHEEELKSMQERIEEISVVGLGGTPANENAQGEDSGEADGEDSTDSATEPANDRDADEEAGNEFVTDIEDDGAPEEPTESATEVQSEIIPPPAENAGANMVGVSEETRQALLVDLGWTPKEINGIRVPPGLDPKAELDEALRQMAILRHLGKTIE